MPNALLTWVPLAIAGLVTYVLTIRISAFAATRGVLDHPDEERKIHREPLRLLGGLGVFLGFTVALVALMPALGGMEFPGLPRLAAQEDAGVLYRTLGIVIAGALAFVLGLFDDLYHIRASSKALGQLVIAIAVMSFGIHWSFLTNPFGPDALSQYPALRLFFYTADAQMLYFHAGWGIALTLIWLVGCMNAINLSDGLDGLASGTTLIAGGAFLFIAGLSDPPQHAAMLLAAAMCGAALGFLPHNFPKAQIILGDAGSQFFGLLLGAIAIEGAFKAAAGLTLVIPFLILGVPIVDTTWAMIRRTLSGQSIGTADRLHLHHRLLNSGLTPLQATLVLWGISGVLAGVAMIVSLS